MPDEHDQEPGTDGPRPPDHMRGRRFRTESPGVGGNTVQDQHRTLHPEPDAHHTSPPDPRFAEARLSDAEKKSLHQAPDLDTACELLGQFQEARHNDGRLPEPVPRRDKPAPLIDSMSPDEQIAHALKPTREQLAQIQAAATFDEQKTRATEFLTERKAQNKALFDRSRHWGPEIDRKTDAAASPQEVRLTGPRHTQAWRADVADLRDFAYRPSTSERAPSLDPRFAHAPMTRAEMEALQQAATPEGVYRLLGEMHEARLKDSRLPQTSGAHPEKALINQALTFREQTELGLRPTAPELAYMQDGAIRGQEHDRAREFIAERKAQNYRWFEHSRQWSRTASRPSRDTSQNARALQENADRQRASSYWYQRDLNSTASAQREAHTEKGERRTDLQQKAEQRQQLREGKSSSDRGQDQHSRDQGGRER